MVQGILSGSRGMATTRVLIHTLHKRSTIGSSATDKFALCCINVRPILGQNALYSTKKSMTRVESFEADNKVQVGLAEVVKENTKSAGYLGFILGGVGITGFLFYLIFNELFSSNSPNGVYTKALERCMKDSQVLNVLGEPIKAYGEETRRGRRGHVSHMLYMKDDVKHMKMQFYVRGIRRKGTVVVDVAENQSGNYEYSYLYVVVDGLRSVIVLEDNRNEGGAQMTTSEFELS